MGLGCGRKGEHMHPERGTNSQKPREKGVRFTQRKRETEKEGETQKQRQTEPY